MTGACASCGGPVEPRSGPGRPAVYCSEPCRRLSEYQIRGLLRRIERAEIELRELLAGDGGNSPWRPPGAHELRVLALRKWLKGDWAKLRALVGGEKAER